MNKKTTKENTEQTEPEELEQHNKPNVQILYEETMAMFANQVIVNSGRDQIVLDFSTGIISDHASGRHVLPIQKRIAMTPANAVKLIQTLSGVIQQQVEASRERGGATTNEDVS